MAPALPRPGVRRRPPSREHPARRAAPRPRRERARPFAAARVPTHLATGIGRRGIGEPRIGRRSGRTPYRALARRCHAVGVETCAERRHSVGATAARRTRATPPGRCPGASETPSWHDIDVSPGRLATFCTICGTRLESGRCPVHPLPAPRRARRFHGKQPLAALSVGLAVLGALGMGIAGLVSASSAEHQAAGETSKLNQLRRELRDETLALNGVSKSLSSIAAKVNATPNPTEIAATVGQSVFTVQTSVNAARILTPFGRLKTDPPRVAIVTLRRLWAPSRGLGPSVGSCRP